MPVFKTMPRVRLVDLRSNWQVVQTKEFEKCYAKYPQKNRIKAIVLSISENPYQGTNIKRLVGDLEGLHRYRFSNFRLIYKIVEETHEIVLITLGSRGDIY